jgi:hypothetical protein
MTTTDRWLLERAEKKKQEDAKAGRLQGTLKSVRYAASFDAELDALWSGLRAEIQRQIDLYNTASGDPGAIVATGTAESLSVRGADGRELTITVDRTHRTLMEAYRNSAGATRSGRPRIGFRVDSEGKLAFNFGVVQSAAGSILRRVID